MTNPFPSPPRVPRETPQGLPIPRFTPWRGRARHDGWTPEAQRRFVYALACGAPISAAAKLVNLTPQSFSRLRRRPGAESFAAACDAAMDMGRDDVWQRAVERVTTGQRFTRFYQGRAVGERRIYDNRLLIAVLNHADRRLPGQSATEAMLDHRRRRLDQWEQRLMRREAALNEAATGRVGETGA